MATRERMKRTEYEQALRRPQIELYALQDWVKQEGLRVLVVFEGRDATGKGGAIKAITERVSPRVFRVVPHFPAASEVVIFDRSWYNRAGVEYVLGFCTKAQRRQFLAVYPKFEKHIGDTGIILIKFWMEVGDEEQKRRFEARIEDPLRQWKLRPTDLLSRGKWYEYSRARDMMFAPWCLVPSDDKRCARLNCIEHLLDLIPYKTLRKKRVKVPKRSTTGACDDQVTLTGRHFVKARY